jgi:hypothetical protein
MRCLFGLFICLNSSFLRIACIDLCFEFGREDVPSGNKISSGNGANGRTGNETRQLSLVSSRLVMCLVSFLDRIELLNS